MKSFYERYWEDREALEDTVYKWSVIKKYIPQDPKIVILDYGCGKGVITEKVLELNPSAKITGVDVSETAIEFVKNKIKNQRFLAIKESEKLLFNDNTFDFILLLDVLEHVYDVGQLLSELHRVLKKNGQILISVPYHGLIKNIIFSLFFFELIFDPCGAHIRFFTKKSLLQCLRGAGFSVEKIGHHGRFFPVSNGIHVLARK